MSETLKGYKQKYGRYSVRGWQYQPDIRDDTETKNGTSPYCMPPGAAIKYLLHDSKFVIVKDAVIGSFLNAVWSHIAWVID